MGSNRIMIEAMAKVTKRDGGVRAARVSIG
jgi:hypothetical protein